MGKNVKVFELNTISDSIKDLYLSLQHINDHCNEGIINSQKVFQSTQEELHTSEMMLEAAKVQEGICLAKKLEVEVRMTNALADEAAAIASGNPVAIAAASAYVAQVGVELSQAVEEYNKAVQYRQKLEHRCELATRCVNIAQEMCETLSMKFNYSKAKVNNIIEKGTLRMQQAYDDLYRYLSRISPDVLVEIEEWEKWEPKENEPTKPQDVRERINVSTSVVNAILHYLYATDNRFRVSIDNLRMQLSIPGNENSVETKIKKNVTGRLCEEIVIRTFGPMGESIETQGRFYLPDGSYTKADMILHGLKSPLILGRGEGMGAREGGDLGIEVKSGNKEYIYSQMEHMEKQAQGHKMCDVSCTICTRDIKDLSAEREVELRKRMKEAGSPILGMLPKKLELDVECIKFVKGEETKENV